MPQQPEAPRDSGKSWLEEKLTAMNALYRKFGRDGLKEHSLADVSLLLSSKELAYRDSPKGYDLSETQKAANRALELEIKDLAGYVNAQLSGAEIFASRTPRFTPSQQKQPQKGRGPEPERRTMPDRELKWLATIRRLEAAYSVGGMDALQKMNALEAQILLSEKLAQLNLVSKGLHQHPHDELGQLRKAKLERETQDISGWVKVKCRVGRGKDLQIDR
jgi:hypothetical protein